MGRSNLLLVIILTFVLLFIGRSLYADGVLIAEWPVKGPLSVKYHRVSISINNTTVLTKVDQVFRNDFDADLEATYLFPLPEDSVITDFALWIDGHRVSGEVLDKEGARRIYEDIVRKMRDPGLLEYIGRAMFRARVYPVPRLGETRMELVYGQTLEYDAGVYEYVYPLDTERFSPKPLSEVTISAEIRTDIPIKSVYSPSHDVDVQIHPNRAMIGYEARDVKPDRDFVLYYTVAEEDVGLNLLDFKRVGEAGYFLMLLSPGQVEGKSMSKDVLFILDTSGSMRGKKLEQASSALRFCINNLREDDRFNIMQFATVENPFREGLIHATLKNVRAALAFIDHFKARGGTNINDALLSALDMFTEEERPRMIVFLTDGEPTVGVTNIGDIVRNIERLNRKHIRIFVFGVGVDVNTHLLDRIYDMNRGVSEYIGSHENIEMQVSSFFRKVNEPILSDIQLDFGRIRVWDLYPVQLPDIFRGTQLVILGRYEGNGMASITLRGIINGEEKRFSYEDRFQEKNIDNDFIPRLWATRKIGYLIGEIRLNGERRELIEEIVRLSKQYGVMTPYTSFLVLENETDYEEWGIPASPQIEESGLRFKRSMEKEKGAEAVASARDIIALKKSQTTRVPSLETIRHVGPKTFYYRDGIWVDSEYTEAIEVKKVKYLSKAYFDLLRRNPQLARYFALSENVMVVFRSVCYRVTPNR